MIEVTDKDILDWLEMQGDFSWHGQLLIGRRFIGDPHQRMSLRELAGWAIRNERATAVAPKEKADD